MCCVRRNARYARGKVSVFKVYAVPDHKADSLIVGVDDWVRRCRANLYGTHFKVDKSKSRAMKQS